ARRRGAPVPSTTVPFLISRSNAITVTFLEMPHAAVPDREHACPARRSVEIHPVELHCVVVNYLALDLRADAGEILLDHFLRMRPGGVGMREVGSPHEPVLAEVVGCDRRQRVILEGRP